MNPPQQQTNSTSNPHGYTHLPENEDSLQHSPIPENQQYASHVQPEHPVIVQGVPIMSYPAVVAHVPIANANRSPLQELDSLPYRSYKYWVLLCIIFNGLLILYKTPFLLAVFDAPLIEVFSAILSCWQVFQLAQIYSGVRQKSVEKMNRGIYLMKIYLVFRVIWQLIDSFLGLKGRIDWENATEEFNNCSNCGPTDHISYAFRLMLILVVVHALWYLTLLQPAIKIRDIFKKLGQNSPASNV